VLDGAERELGGVSSNPPAHPSAVRALNALHDRRDLGRRPHRWFRPFL